MRPPRDMSEKFVAQSFALRRAFDKPGDIHELNRGGNDDAGFGDVLQHLQRASAR